MPDIETARLWYPAEDPVHGFDHVLRVLHMAERLARQEGADLELVRAAVLLHDAVDPDASAQSAIEARLEHHQASARFARQVLLSEGWKEERIAAVEHCIRAHRFRDDREQPQTLEAQVLFDADKLDAIGAIGVARAVAYAASHNQPPFAEPSEQFRQTGQLQPGEPHSAYHELVFKLARLKDRLFTSSARQVAEERHQYMLSFFDRLKAEIAGRL
jgi:uncharacterized protein